MDSYFVNSVNLGLVQIKVKVDTNMRARKIS